jgi:hypothetical protein
MMSEKTWDHAQDITKLFLSTALLVAVPEIQMPLKVASIGIGALNRIIKIGIDRSNNRELFDKISDEQARVFTKAWEHTRKGLEQHTKIILCDELMSVLQFKLGNLDGYYEDEMESIIEKTIADPKRFTEWYTQKSDFHDLMESFWKFYEEELLQTKLLINYYNRHEIQRLMLELSQISFRIAYMEELLDKMAEMTGDAPYRITAANISHYNAWLSNYMQSKIRLYADKPVSGFYDEYIPELMRSYAKPTWKSEAYSLLQDMWSEVRGSRALMDELSPILELVNDNTEYEVIARSINAIVKKVKWSSRVKIGAGLLNKGYGKLALISGEPGSGKTHFLREYLSYSLQAEADAAFIVPLDIDDIAASAAFDSVSLEGFLLSRINACLGASIKKMKSLTHDSGLRVVFMIDDVNRLYLQDIKAFRQLLRGIRELTGYDFIFWLMAVNEFDIYMLDTDQHLLQNYCIDFRQGGGLFSSTLNLSALNEKEALGKMILSLYGIELSPLADNSEAQNFGLEEVICSPVNNPFYAHILGVSGADNTIPYNAAYLDFITELTGYVDRRLKISFPAEYTSISDAIFSVAATALDEGKIEFISSELEAVCSEGVNSKLHSHNLLRRMGEINDIKSRNHLKEQYSLYTSIFWVLKMVIASSGHKEDCEEVYRKLKGVAEYRGELLPCYLLWLDSYERAEDYTRVIELLRRDGLLQYALFASVKASLKYKVRLMEMLKADTDTALSAPESFGLIYYLYSYNTRISNKFYLLNKFMPSVFGHGLRYNLELLTDRLLCDTRSPQSLKKNIRPLFEGKVDDANYILGNLTGRKYYLLCSKETIGKQIFHLADYIKINLPDYDYMTASSGNTFIDHFTRSYFINLIYDRNIGLSKLYNEIEEQERLFDEDIGQFIRRSFSRAAGSVYRSTYFAEYQAQFLSLVAHIMDNETIADYMFAFHFISNSIERGTKRVDKDFIPFLDTMWLDPRMKHFCRDNESRREFFMDNISESAGRYED